MELSPQVTVGDEWKGGREVRSIQVLSFLGAPMAPVIMKHRVKCRSLHCP